MLIIFFQKQEVKNGVMNSSVENIQLDYSTLDSEIGPELFRLNNYILQFNSTTHNMDMGNNGPAYHVYQFHILFHLFLPERF